MHYKEITPAETVKRLKKILSDIHIETEEQWQKESSIGTWALRVVLKGTNIGTNGKGVSKEFSLASAYAELFERYQNDLLGNVSDMGNKTQYAFFSNYDEKFMSAAELIDENSEYIKHYFKVRNMQDSTRKERIAAFKKVQKVDYYAFQKEDSYLCVPFYSAKNKKVYYLPKNIYRLSYGSNGMSAGNTIEEAVVQGLSEIIERYIQRRLFIEKPVLPTIPDDYIKKYPYIYEMYSKLKENDRYEYILKDCSFGGKYPVAALIILEKNTGKYGIKLGCHPDFGVAMERTFTEAAQGQDIYQYSGRSIIDFYNCGVEEETNMYNTYKVGKGQFPYQVFGTDSDYPFTPVRDVSELDNATLMKQWCAEILEEGYDILIRDVSYLGFPSVHIIIPGLSEMTEAMDINYRTYNTRHYVCGLLMNPEKITHENTKYIIATMEYFMPSILENSIETYYPWYNKGDLPFAKSGMGSLYMIAMCYVIEKNYCEAAKTISNLLNILEDENNDCREDLETVHFCKGVYYYLSAMDVFHDTEKVKCYLELIMDKVLTEKILDIFEIPEKVIVKQYPAFQKVISEIQSMEADSAYFRAQESLKKAQVENPINQMSLANILDNDAEWREKNGKQSA